MENRPFVLIFPFLTNLAQHLHVRAKALQKVEEQSTRMTITLEQVEDTVSMVSSTSSGYGSQQREHGELHFAPVTLDLCTSLPFA